MEQTSIIEEIKKEEIIKDMAKWIAISIHKEMEEKPKWPIYRKKTKKSSMRKMNTFIGYQKDETVQ